MAKKFIIEEHIPELDETKECDRPDCGSIGARDFAGEWLCNQCILEDVFDEMNDRDN